MEKFFTFLVSHWALATLFVVLLALIIMNEFRRNLLGFKELAPNDAIRLMNSGEAVLLDVRDDAEFKAGHIINAIHVPVALLEARLAELQPHRDKSLIVYCRTGQRSAQAGTVLNKHGFNKLYKLSGGVMAWQSANLPLVK